ncbi:MAG TPA: hypothetical protein DCS43_06545 [Verrucomicrobia bacterium]|nr:hypothetical protein [Verrucomicrobiota bacterium]
MDFVFIANAWSAAAKNPTGKHQIALTLAAMGHRVLWIEGAGMRRPRASNTHDRSRIRTKLMTAMRGIRRVHPGIWHAAPVIIPIPGNAFIRALNALIYTITGWLGKRILGFHSPVLINFLPVVPLAERLWPWKRIYFCVDRWDQFDLYDSNLMCRVDADCCRMADLVFTTSQDLQHRCSANANAVHYIGHGVDWLHFSRASHPSQCPRPADLPAGRMVGFFGLLSEWIDQDLILQLADALNASHASPPIKIVLIGHADVDITKLKQSPHIEHLPSKPFADLPSYAASFDVAIIPFCITPLTLAVNPIKLREMLAAGCPVVSTALPEVEAVAQTNRFVKTAQNPAEFIAAVQSWLAMPLPEIERKKISDTMQDETWDAKVNAMLNLIE